MLTGKNQGHRVIATIALSIVMVLAAVFARHIGLPRVNVISAFTVSWVAMLVLANVFGGVSDPILDLTWSIVIVSWLSLVAGGYIGWFSGAAARPKQRDPIVIDMGRTVRWHIVLTIVFAIYVAVQLSSALPLILRAGGWDAIFTTGGDAYRNASLQQSLDRSQAGLNSESAIDSIVNYVTFVIGSTATYTGAVLWRARRRLIAMTPVLLAAMLSLMTLQRTSMVFAFLLFVCGIWCVRASGVEVAQHGNHPDAPTRTPHTAARRLGAFFASSVLLAGVGWLFTVTTSARDGAGGGGNGGIQQAIGQYVVGGFAGLNSRNVGGPDWAALPSDSPDHVFDPSPGGGGYTFRGLWSVLSRLGFPVQSTRTNLDFTEVTLFGKQTITNVVTAPGVFYMDFRLPGMIILCFLIGFLCSYFQNRLVASGRVVLIPAISFLLTLSFWSFFVAWTGDFRQLLVAALGGLVLTWVVRKRAPRQPADEPRPVRAAPVGTAPETRLP